MYLMVLSVIEKDHGMDLAGRKKKIYFQGLKIYLFQIFKTNHNIKKYQ